MRFVKQDAAAELQKKFDAGKVTATPEPGEQPAEPEESSKEPEKASTPFSAGL
jgi:hypothetical protein